MDRTLALAAIVVATGVVVGLVVAGDGAAAAGVAAVRDCEAIHRGSVAQPANAWSSLGLVAVGAAIATLRTGWRAVTLGGAVAAVGLASFASHATLPDGPTHVDGAAITALGTAVVVVVTGGRIRSVAAGVGVGATVAALLIDDAATALSAAGLLAGLAAVALTHRSSGRDGRSGSTALALLGGAWVVWLVSGESGPLCRPGSWWQWHAVWHLAAALGLATLAAHLLAGPRDKLRGTSTLGDVEQGG